MKKPGADIPPGAYLAGKYRQAEDKKDRLLDVLNRLSQVSYEKGTRRSDEAIRETVAALVSEVEQQYRMVRSFAAGKGGDTAAFRDILEYFDGQYLERFVLRDLFEGVLKEIARQEQVDRDYGDNHPDAEHIRKLAVYRQDLSREIQECEKLLLHQADPLLRSFLGEVNDIFLFRQIEGRIDRLVTSDDVFARTGPAYQEFKASLAFHAAIQIKLARLPQNDAEIIETISRVLQQSGFRNTILRARNVNPDIYREIMTEVIEEGDLRGLVKRFSDTSRGAIDAIRSADSKIAAPVSGPDVKKALEELIYLEEFAGPQRPAGVPPAAGLAKNEADRYLFHAPGTFDISLRFVSEYMRDSMIFVFDWLNKELQKYPSSAALLGPLLESLPSVSKFISYYRLALDMAADRSNQSGSGPREKHFISKAAARGLLQSIRDNCSGIRLCLIDVSYGIMNSTRDRAEILNRQLEVVKDSCNAAHVKISKGLSDIEKV